MSRIDRLICHVLPKAFLMALTAGGRLADLKVVRRDKPSHADSVFLGRLERVMPELDAAFVDIGVGQAGFLRAVDRVGVDAWPPPGAPLLVQVRTEGDGENGKGPRLSMNIAVTGRYLVYQPVGSGVTFSRRIENESEREAGSSCARPRPARRSRCCAPTPRTSSIAGKRSADRPSICSRRPTLRRAFRANAILWRACCATMAPRSKK